MEEFIEGYLEWCRNWISYGLLQMHRERCTYTASHNTVFALMMIQRLLGTVHPSLYTHRL